MTISIAGATIVSMIVQALFFGFFVVLFFYAQYILFAQRERSFNKPLWAASIMMFLIATAQLALDGQRFMAAFVTFQDDPQGQLALLASLSSGSFVAKNLLYQVQTYIGDACIIYRTYILYRKNLLVVIAPCLLLCGCIASGTGLIYHFATAPFGTTPEAFQGWAISYIVVTLLSNLICTVLIVSRIWGMSFGPLRKDRGRAAPIIVIVESGGVYSASLIVLSILGGANSPGYVIALDLLCPIIGITFVMIIIRLHQEKQHPSVILSNSHSQQHHGGHNPPHVEYPMQHVPAKSIDWDNYAQKPLPSIKIAVNREVDVNEYV